MFCHGPCFAHDSALQLMVFTGCTSISVQVQLLPCSKLPAYRPGVCTGMRAKETSPKELYLQHSQYSGKGRCVATLLLQTER